MIPKLAIDLKRTGAELPDEDIRDFINGFTRGEITDAQMSALAMAICCRGMSERETATLTDAMMRSGRVLEWEGTTADKHSTGGVGDKLSFIIQPLAAACGVAVPSLVGRGLGFTGGTADKIETIPGCKAALSIDEFRRVVEEVGVSMAVQTEEMTPADRKLYALRDVTGTVSSIPLIVSSILSKKLAEGAGTLVFDVKCGSGAFMRTREDATALAHALVGGARAAGRKASAFVTDMSAPLGYAVGNVNEVAEALAILRGEDDRRGTAEETALSLDLAAEMVSLSLDMPVDEALRLCREKLSDGSAAAKFEEMVAAQGGDLAAFGRLAGKKPFRFALLAPRSGYVAAIDALEAAKCAFRLGAGRGRPGDRIDPVAGVTFEVVRGDKVRAGEPLATLVSSINPDELEGAAAELLGAFAFSDAAPGAKGLVIKKIS